MPQRLLIVPPSAAGQRLDRWLTEQLPEQSRSEIQRWIEQGLVQVAGRSAKSNTRLEADQPITVNSPDTPLVSEIQAEAIPLQIVYEDDDLLVIDKAAGLVVHPSAGHESGTLVNAVLHHVPDIEGVGGERRPGIVHRLDKETSGLLVIAKHDRALRHLQAQFKARTVYKEYLALVEGIPQPSQGRIDAPMGRHPVDRLRQAVWVSQESRVKSQESALVKGSPGKGQLSVREAVTDYWTLATYHYKPPGMPNPFPFTLLRVVLHTGRTHQIRVHFAWLRHPIVGDTLYGLKQPRLPITRQFLHAHRMRIRLPGSQEEREFIAPLPAELQEILERFEE